MSELMRKMYHNLAAKSGYRIQRGSSKTRRRSPSSGVLDLTSEKHSTPGEKKTHPVQEIGDGPRRSQRKRISLPPEPEIRPVNANSIYTRRSVPLESPALSETEEDSFPADESWRKHLPSIPPFVSKSTSTFFSDWRNVSIFALFVAFLSLIISFGVIYWAVGRKSPTENEIAALLSAQTFSCGRPESSDESSALAETRKSSLQLGSIHLPSIFEPEVGFDYSLATLGAKVLTTRHTKPLVHLDATLLGYSVWKTYLADSQSDAPLQPLLIPGRCWRFAKFPGTLVIQLAENIAVTSFSLSHVLGPSVPRNRLNSSPREFEVWGLNEEDDPEPYLFGNYTFLQTGPSTQEFPVMHPSSFRFPIVELKVLSNYGSQDYTCVYRFKVFGNPVGQE